ncbi:unnamed protein product [Gordionus sp. m RMFG-2023]
MSDENYILQMQEIDMIKNMYKEEFIFPKENSLNNMLPSYNLKFNGDKIKYEIFVEYPKTYPLGDSNPVISIFTNDITKNKQQILNQKLINLNKYLSKSNSGELRISNMIQFIQDFLNDEIINGLEENPLSSNPIQNSFQTPSNPTTYSRYWIYSHHIYNPSKRKFLLQTAQENDLTGFVLPGKPGIICIEGLTTSCQIFWNAVKRLTWKKIMLKHEEEISIIDNKKHFLSKDNFRYDKKFEGFKEIVLSDTKYDGFEIGSETQIFDNNKQRNSRHQDMGKFSLYLKTHGCEHIFCILFNI